MQMKKLYEAPEAEELLFLSADPIALSEDTGVDDGFSGGVPFSIRDLFNVHKS